MGCGDRSVAFILEYRITNPSSSRKLLTKSQIQTQSKLNQDVEQLSHVDHVATNAHSSQGEFQLYIFEDNEAVIKMIIKGTSPTIGHVSRTLRVALDWLFDRIIVDPVVLRVMNGIIFSIVEHPEFLDVSLQPCSFKQKAECHVQESS